MLLEALSAFLTGFLAPLIRGLISDWRAAQALREAGAADAARETSHTIQEIADAQRANDARDRGGAGDVARRLRERIGDGG
ncbi:hypothetical protein [Amorphus sp. 3PC139-8]|uniref:hypothetical protein n=1 Tax=Amorphus sp. 3PC139-8 TaxID=2735676 RepID=UPI00345D954A